MRDWVIEVRVGEIIGRWHGGEYIELHDEISMLTEIESAPFASVNVWDYAAGAPRIAATPDAILAEVRAYIATQDEAHAIAEDAVPGAFVSDYAPVHGLEMGWMMTIIAVDGDKPQPDEYSGRLIGTAYGLIADGRYPLWYLDSIRDRVIPAGGRL